MAIERIASEHFPYLPLQLKVGDRTFAAEALIDTGFDGDVAIPVALMTDQQPPDEYRSWMLADGSAVETAVYYGFLTLGAFPAFEADIVCLGDEAIVGRGVTDRYRVILEHGTRVVVEL